MDPRLQELIDHHEIRQLLATYCHGCDRADEVEMASVYREDSWDDHGTYKMPGRPFSIQTVSDALATTDLVAHLLGQSQIRVTGDKAGAETYFIATLLYPPKHEGEPQTIGQLGGRYVDALVREEGKWSLENRICIREWSHSHPVAGDWLAHAGFAVQHRGQADASYAALGLTHSGNPWLHEVAQSG
ncbi:MAG: nuclear transport factor 2 family protein [Novosphingobium sp.]